MYDYPMNFLSTGIFLSGKIMAKQIPTVKIDIIGTPIIELTVLPYNLKPKKKPF
jgi:hypothetical protein